MKKLLWIVLLVAVIVAVFGAKEYFRGHDDLNKKKADFVVNTNQLVADFEQDEEVASKKYVDKIVEVSGKVVENKLGESERTITLEGDGMLTNIACQMVDSSVGAHLEVGSKATLRCKCNGKLMDINMNMCVVAK